MARLAPFMRIAVLAAGLVPALALAQAAIQLCPQQNAVPDADGRVLGHIPYPEVAPSELVAAPPGFGVGLPCRVHHDMLPDLAKMLIAAAAEPGVGHALHGVSCFRTVAHQRAVFCSQVGPGRRCRTVAERARESGPPGYSEHATGYAIDFAVRPSRGCPDVDPCLAQSPAGQWLIAHAPEFGFELSFPDGNAQGVAWEPWHWRWVGTRIDEPGAARARLTVARARTDFPASPAVPDQPEPAQTPLQPIY